MYVPCSERFLVTHEECWVKIKKNSYTERFSEKNLRTNNNNQTDYFNLFENLEKWVVQKEKKKVYA